VRVPFARALRQLNPRRETHDVSDGRSDPDCRSAVPDRADLSAFPRAAPESECPTAEVRILNYAGEMPPENAHVGPGQAFDSTVGGAGNLSSVWKRHWETDPQARQIHDPDRGWLCRGDLESISATLAGRLARLGLSPGDRILISAESSSDFVAGYVACVRMGLVVLPTNTAYGARELTHVVRDARPRAAIVDDPIRAELLAEIAPELHRLDPAIALPDGPTPPLDSATPESPTLLCYTSGTTGQPKGAVLSHANCLASAAGLEIAWRWTEHDRLLLALPLFHMHGLGVGLHGTLFTGASAVLYRGFRPDDIIAGISSHEASLFFGVPTMYHRLANHAEAAKLADLRLCVSGSAPLPASLHEQIERVGHQRVLERYGMTETLMLVSNPFEGKRKPGSVGRPLPGVELRLAGEPPEIQVRGPKKPSPTTAGSTPAISAPSTRTAMSRSSDVQRNSSSAAASTSTPEKSKT